MTINRTSKWGGKRDYRSRESGFTLVELMTVLIIVAVLMMVALPAYQDQVKRTNRAAALSEMMHIANLQQQYLLSNRSYLDKAGLEAAGYTPDPDVQRTYSWDMVISTVSVPTYVMTFTPIGAQVGESVVTLNEQGVGTPADLWDR